MHGDRRATQGQQEYDSDGKIAACGQVNEILLTELLAHPYYSEPPPKTTGREVFGNTVRRTTLERYHSRSGISSDDLIATLTMLTARIIADSGTEIFANPARRNHCFWRRRKESDAVKTLQNEIGPAVRVRRIDQLGIPADAKEALAFAILAYETWHGRPSNLPAATGAKRPVIQGDITPGLSWNHP